MTVVTVDGIERIGKLMTPSLPKGCVTVTPAEWADISRTIDYRMDNWAGIDQIVRVHDGRVLAYSKGRGDQGLIWLHPDFAREIEKCKTCGGDGYDPDQSNPNEYEIRTNTPRACDDCWGSGQANASQEDELS